MIGRDEIALNAVDCHLRTSIWVSLFEPDTPTVTWSSSAQR
jgi:hypothetical protein